MALAQTLPATDHDHARANEHAHTHVLTQNCAHVNPHVRPSVCNAPHAADMKMHLASTDYGNFLQNEPSPISSSTLQDKCTVRLLAPPNISRHRSWFVHEAISCPYIKLMDAWNAPTPACRDKVFRVSCKPNGQARLS